MKLDLADLRALVSARTECLSEVSRRLRGAADLLDVALPPPSLEDGDAAITATRLEPIAREVLSLGASLLEHAAAYRTLALVDRCSCVSALALSSASAAPPAQERRRRVR